MGYLMRLSVLRGDTDNRQNASTNLRGQKLYQVFFPTTTIRNENQLYEEKQGLPWWCREVGVVKNLPASADDTGSTPVWEDCTCHGATKPMRTPTEAMLHKRSHLNEKSLHCQLEGALLTATRESPRAATKTHCSCRLIN